MKSVLITGSSTGIGRAVALRLDAYGWQVFAGVRNDEDAQKLSAEASSALHPVILDVTEDDTLKAAVETVVELTDGRLDGLVNNAGTTVQAPLEYLPPDELRRQFDVNVTGQLACTQAFLPALRSASGRIVFISSIQGRTRSLPLLGPYCVSKWALEALADTFRIELRDSDIKVAVVEPGTIETPIWDKADDGFEKIKEEIPQEGLKRYARLLDRGRDLADLAKATGVSPDRVARKIQHALSAPRPKIRYVVGDARSRILLEKPLPDRFRDWFISRLLVR